jgi:putative transposase
MTMPIRKTPLHSTYIYHIFNRGINHAPIFINRRDYQRFLDLLDYCRFVNYPIKFSSFKSLPFERKQEIKSGLKEKSVSFISYCLMPNHFHFVLRQEKDNGISSFVNRFLTSYTKFFNTRHKRSGPLFENRFKAVLVETDEQLVHLVRYIHLNPHSSGIVKNLAELLIYPWSSIKEYLNSTTEIKICDLKELVLSRFTNEKDFRKFTLNQAEYQKNLERIKHLLEE